MLPEIPLNEINAFVLIVMVFVMRNDIKNLIKRVDRIEDREK